MSNKKNISVRLSVSDLRRLKEVSAKLGIKDSDLFRFSVKMTLSSLMPLLKQDIKGVDFLLAMLDAGSDLLRYFEFDSHLLDRVVNDQVEADKKVSMMDIDLVAIAALNERYLISQLRDIGETVNSNDDPLYVLKRYLQKKYCASKQSEEAEIA